MTVELTEDSQARGWRFNKTRAGCVQAIRAWLVYGVPPFAIFALVSWIYFEKLTHLCLVAAFVPVIFSLLFLVVPYLERCFHRHNRWIVTERKLKVRGSDFKNVRWEHVTSCSTRKLTELPGYYVLHVWTKYYGSAHLVLSEVTMTPHAAEKLIAEHQAPRES